MPYKAYVDEGCCLGRMLAVVPLADRYVAGLRGCFDGTWLPRSAPSTALVQSNVDSEWFECDIQEFRDGRDCRVFV